MTALFPNLEALILRSAPPHVAVPYAPEDLADLNDWANAQHTPDYGREPWLLELPVWNGASDSTIYSSPEVNFAYRAWHDWLHLQLQADVSYADERRVSEAHYQIATAAGIPEHEVMALWYDSHGQNVYHQYNGCFVKDQRGFVLNCLEHGLEATLLSTW